MPKKCKRLDSMSIEHWMRRAFWREYLRILIFFPAIGGTTVYGRRLYKVTLAPSIGSTKHDASYSLLPKSVVRAT
jgi:hypothetical protein